MSLNDQSYSTVEEVGDSSPREWRIMQSGLTRREAGEALLSLRNSSPSARGARGESDGIIYNAMDLVPERFGLSSNWTDPLLDFRKSRI